MNNLLVSVVSGGLCLCLAQANAESLTVLAQAAKKEGAVYSVGMPDDWANWKDTWAQVTQKYGLSHRDTDLSSAEELAKFEAEKTNATADIGDVGHTFGPVALQKGLTQPYKPSTWNDIPSWAKDKDGHWVLAYTGTISFITNNQLVKEPPKSWADLLKGKYKVTLGAVGVSARANSAVLAAALARGGDEKNLKPALEFFGQLAKQGRLSLIDPSLANLEKGEIEVGILWDFTSLSYRDRIDSKRFTVSIPTDGSVTTGYTTIINKYAKHPNAAKLVREYVLSDAGQVNLARGYARPIRSNVSIPADVQAKLLPASQYKVAKPIRDFAAWEDSTKKLPRQWQEMVMVNMQ
ncbi:ABC transporter, periplasmic binding protein [Pseudogulbenkiania sp. NH8B]|uniref:ABC transporter substrate-binding protein n=1 Tax=Pseudogulbenkiania sp. (strain NH8B) TaxID=748280 RepID=UPI00022798E0|nr:extracellular solute-binding protein [Pseudogulbenkiania sp. NH8B]BAK76808.1 ABC transporter, periplasmic binding protein [Pseudogulbenkiania sp. NH8B]